MDMRGFILAATLSLTLGACTPAASALTADIKTSAQVDQKVRFAGVKSYAWFETEATMDDSLNRWKGVGFDIPAEIQFLIERELRERGVVQVDDEPDVFIGFVAAATVDHFEQVQRRGGQVPDVEGVGESSLVIELIDADTEHTIWVGVAQGETQTGRTDEQVRARLDYMVTELLKQLPTE